MKKLNEIINRLLEQIAQLMIVIKWLFKYILKFVLYQHLMCYHLFSSIINFKI